MPFFQNSVLGFAVRFLSPFPASLPQLFHRCLPSAFASGLFRSPSASFRPLPVPFRLLGLLFFRSRASPSGLTAAFQVLPSFLSSLRFFQFRSTRFPVLPFPFPVLGFPFVSFRPSQLRSHGCFTGAHLSVSLRCSSFASLSFVRSALGFDYSASALSFPFIPASPRSGSFRCLFICFPFACFHAPIPLWYSASCSSFHLFSYVSPRRWLFVSYGVSFRL